MLFRVFTKIGPTTLLTSLSEVRGSSIQHGNDEFGFFGPLDTETKGCWHWLTLQMKNYSSLRVQLS
jgi:hypothetical protein